MADLSVRPENAALRPGSLDWSAIWGGVFTFLGIWSVFELLGIGIFSSLNAGTKAGFDFWTIVLTAIVMFIAGRLTSSCARETGWRHGIRHGVIMFGLSLAASIVLLMVGAILLSDLPALNGSARGSYLMNALTSSGWVLFATLFLGWLGAIVGASSSVPPKAKERPTVQQMRPAA